MHDGSHENWVVHLIDTGLTTQTGGRIKRVAQFIGDEPFMLTYGYGVSNINITALLDFHRRQGKLATLTAIRPPARFGPPLVQGGPSPRSPVPGPQVLA